MALKAKQKHFLKKFEVNRGLVYQTCKEVGICPQTFYNWKKDDDFNNKVDFVLEQQIDQVELKLLTRVDDDDLGAIVFYLKSKARNRGYGDRTDVYGSFTNLNMQIPQSEQARKLGVDYLKSLQTIEK